MFITEDGVYAVGNGKRNRLGLQTEETVKSARRVDRLNNKGRPFAVTAGDFFSVVLV
jgi:alpha-tubulin suppressor-like RCC1 family protein